MINDKLHMSHFPNQTLTNLCVRSIFIARLVAAGYNYTDHTTLLNDMDMHDSPTDIGVIFDKNPYSGDSKEFDTALIRLGINRAVFICDEFAMRDIVLLMMYRYTLDKLSDNQIINCIKSKDFIHAVVAYNKGYRIISPYGFEYEATMSSIHAVSVDNIINAWDNGLYTQHIIIQDSIESFTAIARKDIYSELTSVSCANTANLSPIELFPNVNTLCVNGHTLDVCDTSKHAFAKNIVSLSSPRILYQEYVDLFINLKQLDVSDNVRVTSCNSFAKSLTNLTAKGRCGITDNGLALCTNLRRLNIHNNRCITTCEPFTSLIVLIASVSKYTDRTQTCAMNDNGLRKCTTIRKLIAYNNPNITTCDPFAKSLKVLHAGWINDRCGIGDAGLRRCTNLRKLIVCGNKSITTCRPFANSLITLNACGMLDLCDNALKLCTKLRTLYRTLDNYFKK